MIVFVMLNVFEIFGKQQEFNIPQSWSPLFLTMTLEETTATKRAAITKNFIFIE